MDAYSYYSRPYGHFDVSVGQICWLWSPTLFWTPLSARSKQILHTTAPRQLSGAAIYEKRSGWTKVNIFHLHYHLNIGRQKSIFFFFFGGGGAFLRTYFFLISCIVFAPYFHLVIFFRFFFHNLIFFHHLNSLDFICLTLYPLFSFHTLFLFSRSFIFLLFNNVYAAPYVLRIQGYRVNALIWNPIVAGNNHKTLLHFWKYNVFTGARYPVVPCCALTLRT